jgi:nitroimidazol reductase NimA-like FMN-containing flavoprotein (pyridoxamine 5'-phosphate oxidase superfamily)
MWLDQRGSEVLGRNECLRLLAVHAGGVGRVGLVGNTGGVVIEPVIYRVLDGDVLIQVGPGSLLDAARRPSAVAFETDHLDLGGRQAWSVLVRGLATVIDDRRRAAGARPPAARPLVPVPGDTLVRIRTDILSGRRFALRTPASS